MTNMCGVVRMPYFFPSSPELSSIQAVAFIFFIICFGLWLNVPCKKALVRKTCNSDSGSFSKDQAIADARSVAARRQEISQPSIFWRHNRCYWPVETFARARSPGDFVSAPDSVG